MDEILDFYQQQATASLSSIPWLAQLQSTALTDLHRRGFPGRHDEEWKYTSVDALLKESFTPYNKELATSATKTSDLPVTQQIVIRNGLISGIDQLTRTLPAGVLVLPLAAALSSHPELLKPYLGSILKQEHAFHFLNTAMIHCGVLLYIPSGVCIEDPIALIHLQDQMNQSVHLRHLIIAEAGSEAALIEEYQGLEHCCYLTNTVTEVFLGANAKLTHYKIQRESKSAYHLGHVSVKQCARSEFAHHSLSLGGKCVRSDLSLYLQEERALA